MATTIDALGRAETHLSALSRETERRTIDRWRTECRELAQAPLTGPGELRAWLREEPAQRVEEVLRSLVTLAQRGDTTALLAVVVCLAPGIRSLARRTGLSADEAMSEVTLGILEYPIARRRSVAGGLLLDARNRIGRAARRAARPIDRFEDEGAGPGGVTALGADAGGPTTAERVLALLCEAHRKQVVTRDDAQLIVDTRLSGRRMAPAAARLGMSPQAGYQRRSRAERRITVLAQTQPYL